MSATHATQSTVPQGPVLYMAIELSLATWKLAFTVGSGQKPRIRSVPAGDSLVPPGRDQVGQKAIRPSRRYHRDFLLRGRPRWFLDSSVPD